MIKSIHICTMDIRKWASDPKIYILYAMVFILTNHFTHEFKMFSRHTGYRITPWIFPFLIDSFIFQLLIIFGIVFLFCDAPFMDDIQPYLLIRSTRHDWILGKIYYIIVATFIFLLFVNISIILSLTPYMYYSSDWGKVLATLAQTNASNMVQLIAINKKILTNYTPFQAMTICFLLEWFCGIIIGLTLFSANTLLNKRIGILITSCIPLLDILFNAGFSSFSYHFSPTSMARLSILDTSGFSRYPTPQYAFIFLLFLIGILLAGVILIMKNQEINVIERL